MAAVEFENPAGYVVEEVTIMRYCDDGAGVEIYGGAGLGLLGLWDLENGAAANRGGRTRCSLG